MTPSTARAASTKATLIFDTTNFLSTDSRAGTTSFTLKDIITNSTIEHVHSTQPGGAKYSFMSNTASMDLFNIDNDGRWVIKSKWECPTLQFSGTDANQITNDSITDMIRKMDKYVVPPPYDFVTARDNSRGVLSTKVDFTQAGTQAPFSMYFFEFSSDLNQQDLADVWQGVMPTVAKTADKETVILEHPIVDGELLSPSIFKHNKFESIPDDIRWKIFKVKKRASYDYYKMTEKQTGVPTYKRSRADRFSFNWPYDYCSLVELGKMEVEFEVQSDSPNRIKDIRGGGYITPEDAVRRSIDLGAPLTLVQPANDTSPIVPFLSIVPFLDLVPVDLSRTPSRPVVDVRSEERCNDPVAINYLQPAPCRYREPDGPPPRCNDARAINFGAAEPCRYAPAGPSCPDGEVYDTATGRCKKVAAQKTCPAGYILDVSTGRCKEVPGPAPRCNDPAALNFGAAEPCRYAPADPSGPSAQQQQKGPMKFPSQPDCPRGTVYDAVTGECKQKVDIQKALKLLS